MADFPTARNQIRTDAAELARLLSLLPEEPAFQRFLAATGRIYSRRKEDLQKRRATDLRSSRFSTQQIMVQSFKVAQNLVREFEAWCEMNGVNPERREHG